MQTSPPLYPLRLAGCSARSTCCKSTFEAFGNGVPAASLVDSLFIRFHLISHVFGLTEIRFRCYASPPPCRGWHPARAPLVRAPPRSAALHQSTRAIPLHIRLWP